MGMLGTLPVVGAVVGAAGAVTAGVSTWLHERGD